MINFPQRNWTDYGGEVTVMHKVIGPDMVTVLRPQSHTRSIIQP